MAATEILASGTATTGASALSSVVTLAAGSSCNFVVFAAGGDVPTDAVYDLVIAASNGTKTRVKRMTGGDFTVNATGPGDYYVERKAAGKAGTASGVDKNV